MPNVSGNYPQQAETSTIFLCVPGLVPMAYQRYATNNHGKRFKPKSLASYQSVIEAAALKRGFHKHDWGWNIRARVVFVCPAQDRRSWRNWDERADSWGISANMKDTDNMLKAFMDALNRFFNDRFVSEVHAVKLCCKDKNLQGIFARFDTSRRHVVSSWVESAFGEDEEARRWLESMRLIRSSS